MAFVYQMGKLEKWEPVEVWIRDWDLSNLGITSWTAFAAVFLWHQKLRCKCMKEPQRMDPARTQPRAWMR